MKVLLCDDDAKYLDIFEKKLMRSDCEVYKFRKSEDVFNSCMRFDIAFVDIEFGGKTVGFDIAKWLNEQNKSCVVAFLTRYREYAVDGYGYSVFRYILKTEPEVLINRRINEVFAEYYKRNEFLTGSYKGNDFLVATNDIYFIEVYNHILRIYTKKGMYELYEQIKVLEERLEKLGFFRCHRSFLVNMKYVKLIEKGVFYVLTVSGERKVPIGISYKMKAKEKYVEYNKKGEF